MATLLVLHGPNLNLLGTREPDKYGATTLAEINQDLERRAREAGHHLLHLQSNAEVGSKLAGWRLIRFDITESNAAQRALLDRYNLFGPPAIQLFAGNGDELLDLRVVGEINAATFAGRLDQASSRLGKR